MPILRNAKLTFVAGHRGMVGSALVRKLRQQETPILLADRQDLDLCDAQSTRQFVEAKRPEVVIIAAAQVGGILANSSFPVEFLANNLKIAINLIQASYECGVKRLLFLGSTCIYPRDAPQPIPESALLGGPLEITNEAYAIAKIAGLKLCQYYRKQYGVLYHSAMPTNLYGPGDNYHPENSHVLPSLIRRFHEAKISHSPEVVIWGSGTPLREFMHVDDLADALIHLLGVDNPPDWVNVGSGEEVSIHRLAMHVAKTVGFKGEIKCDPTRPDGTPRKMVDARLLSKLGWRASISLKDGLAATYQSFLDELNHSRLRNADV